MMAITDDGALITDLRWEYLNFLRVGNNIFMAQLGETSDEPAFERIRAAFPDCTVYPIKYVKSSHAWAVVCIARHGIRPRKPIKMSRFSRLPNVIPLTRSTKTLLRKNGYEQLWNITKERNFRTKNGMLSIVHLKRIGIIYGLMKGISPSGTWFTISMRILHMKDVRILFSEVVFPASAMT